MKKLAACDFEDLLQVESSFWSLTSDLHPIQCAVACFEGLFEPKHDVIVQDLLFMFASWHAYAKLQLHTSSSKADWGRMTYSLGQLLCHFKSKVCSVYKTKETPHEAACHVRSQGWHAKKLATLKYHYKTTWRIRTVKKKFNLSMIKGHSIGHYEEMVETYGMTDLYSTLLVWVYNFHTSLHAHSEVGQMESPFPETALWPYK